MTDHEKRLNIQRLRHLAANFRREAVRIRSAGNLALYETKALNLEQDAAAISWAVRELEPTLAPEQAARLVS